MYAHTYIYIYIYIIHSMYAFSRYKLQETQFNNKDATCLNNQNITVYLIFANKLIPCDL